MSDTTQQKLKDDALLASLGYKQEFKREFKPVELFGLSFSMIGLFLDNITLSSPSSDLLYFFVGVVPALR